MLATQPKTTSIATMATANNMEHEEARKSVLDCHNIPLDNKTTMSFLSYYATGTPLYYEVEPFIKALKFTNVDETLRQLSPQVIKYPSYLNDPKFAARKVPETTAFIESHAMVFLFAMSESKTRTNIVKLIYDTDLRKIENDRNIENGTRITILEDETKLLKEEVKRLMAKHHEFRNFFTGFLDKFSHQHKEHAAAVTNAVADVSNNISAWEQYAQSKSH